MSEAGHKFMSNANPLLHIKFHPFPHCEGKRSLWNKTQARVEKCCKYTATIADEGEKTNVNLSTKSMPLLQPGCGVSAENGFWRLDLSSGGPCHFLIFPSY